MSLSVARYLRFWNMPHGVKITPAVAPVTITVVGGETAASDNALGTPVGSQCKCPRAVIWFF